jgi:hypothetical protein
MTKKEKVVGLIAFISVAFAVVLSAQSPETAQSIKSEVQAGQSDSIISLPENQAPLEIKPAPQPDPPPAQENNSSYYKNKDGDLIPSPKFYDSAPDGASARCRDGTYSFSRNRRGTCSHHGGVDEWL